MVAHHAHELNFSHVVSRVRHISLLPVAIPVLIFEPATLLDAILVIGCLCVNLLWCSFVVSCGRCVPCANVM